MKLILFRKRQNSKQVRSTKHEYVNTASDQVVTDNVVYNMEFPADTKQPQIPLTDSDTEHQSEKTNLQATYKNLQLDEDGGAYNTVSFDVEHDMKKIHTPLKNNTFKIDNDGGAYDTLELNEESTRAEDIKYLKSHGSQNIGSDALYTTFGQETNTNSTIPARDPVSKEEKETDITYAVVDNEKTSDVKYNRPKQFQVADSCDTYALVNKETIQ